MSDKDKLIAWILKVSVATLASITIAVVVVLMVGIFLPNEQIDNKEILAIIGPAFNTVIGAFVGLLGGLSLSGGNEPNTASVSSPVAAPVAAPVEEEKVEPVVESSPS